jgi:uncharacterized protein YecT (DUF1311 family)
MQRVHLLLVAVLIVVAWTSAGFGAAAQPGQFQQASPASPYTLLAQLDTILQHEMASERAGDCNNARNTFDENVCLSNAIQTTTDNFKAYADTLRTLLRLQSPHAAPYRFSGPTGSPPLDDDMASEFDNVERAWDSYRTALCTATFHANQGGTVAPSMEGRCALEVIRAHMRELNVTLRPELH